MVMMRRVLGVAIVSSMVASSACRSPGEAKLAGKDTGTDGAEASAEAPASSSGQSAAPRDTPSTSAGDAGASAQPARVAVPNVVDWVRERLPKGGQVTAGTPPKVTHHVAPGDTAQSLAKLYFPITEIYTEEELARALAKAYPKLAAGAEVEIPSIVHLPYGYPDAERIGWPEDKSLRGVFVTGAYAGIRWVDTLDKLAERGLNAVVLDGKDYMGTINYPTKVPLAVEMGAAKHLFVPDLQRAIRVAHVRGIRVIMRIPCFHDPWAQDHAPRLSIQGNWGRPFRMGWTDPTNREAQDYNIALAIEQMDAGADEIQLDYVRFPVHPGTQKAVLPTTPGERPKIIRDFVARVHEETKKRGVPLSLDLFGVASTGDPNDIDKLGQNITMLAPVCEAISPMAYASHYAPGWHGFAEPGEHPEVVAISNKGAVAKLPKGSTTVIRSWLQAFPLRAKNYGPKYVADQAKHAETSGGVGWLMWSPACEYSAVWHGFPKKSAPR